MKLTMGAEERKTGSVATKPYEIANSAFLCALTVSGHTYFISPQSLIFPALQSHFQQSSRPHFLRRAGLS